jgi:hypothetical protein
VATALEQKPKMYRKLEFHENIARKQRDFISKKILNHIVAYELWIFRRHRRLLASHLRALETKQSELKQKRNI